MIKKTFNIFSLLSLFCVLFGCNSDKGITSNPKEEPSINSSDIKLFDLVPTAHSKVEFSNILEEQDKRIWYNFNRVYNGGGVALGDINNDNLPDLFFTGNESPNKLYLNKGGLVFEDITESAKVTNNAGWHNGVSMVDINGDGWLDIYICRGGWIDDPQFRTNLLYINDKQGGFIEMAERFGLSEPGYSFQSLFFDYDLDGDLDVYIINHPRNSTKIPDYIEGRKNGAIVHKDRLYRNNGNTKFEDITIEAGLNGTYGYGLSVTSSDLDGNGYPDIYVANDYTEADYLFMNKGDGTFEEKIKDMTGHISLFAMGTDIADYNNDGLEDIFITEMLPKDYKRSKTQMAPMNTERFNKIVDEGFHYQYMHNTLQLNRGNGHFSEISQMAGVAKTDWSWACFLSDLDNDGYRDLFVSNGYKRDVYDRDAQKKASEYLETNERRIIDMDQFLKLTPSSKSTNYLFKNKDGLKFKDLTSKWGSSMPSFSNGATIGDLDNDGDLDIVTNNFDEPVFIYENKASQKLNANYLRVKLKGPRLNGSGIGSEIKIQCQGLELYEQFKTTRGYLSSVEHVAHFGLGQNKVVDKITVKWYDGKVSELRQIKANQVLTIDYADAQTLSPADASPGQLVSVNPKAINQTISHAESPFDDYKDQVLLPHKMSQLGPFVSKGDVDGDGLEDVYVGGAKGQPGSLLIQQQDGTLSRKNISTFKSDASHEDMGSLFFDADGDKDLDLYVVSGSTEMPKNSPYYLDRLYINDGRGGFKRDKQALPSINVSGSCVKPQDYDNDGDIDLFIGGRATPNFYPNATPSYILNNNKGQFELVSTKIAPLLNYFGMVTDAEWTDIDRDGRSDLVLVGEWLPISIILNKPDGFINATADYGLDKTNGWWNAIKAVDLDKDGDLDFVLGNLGQNYKFKASKEKPFHAYCNDFDGNGTFDVFLAKEVEGVQVPVRGRECSSQQVPHIWTKFSTYSDFANADINTLLGEGLQGAMHLEAKEFSSVIMRNNKGRFELEKLPMLSQISTINAIEVDDYNKDGIYDLLVAGNLYQSEAETTRADASIGLMLLGQKDGTYQSVPALDSGVNLPYDVKDMVTIELANKKKRILVAVNDEALMALDY